MRLLHVLPRFADDDEASARVAQLARGWGGAVGHAVAIGDGDIAAARARIGRRAAIEPLADVPPLAGAPTPGRLQRLARAMRGHDLVLSYDWGAIDAALARTLFGEFLRLPPLVHHELTLAAGERAAGSRRRDWYRRVALGRAAALVAGDEEIERRALARWQQPRAKVRRIAPGIDTRAFAAKPRADALPRLIKRPGERWLGCLSPDGDLRALVRAAAALGEEWHLVLPALDPDGDAAVRDEALAQAAAHRVHLPGAPADAAAALALLDLAALAPGAAAPPRAVLAAMAAGLALAAPPESGAVALLAEENRRVLGGDALALLARDGPTRRAAGEANRRRARGSYDAAAMIAATGAACAAALRRPSFP